MVRVEDQGEGRGVGGVQRGFASTHHKQILMTLTPATEPLKSVLREEHDDNNPMSAILRAQQPGHNEAINPRNLAKKYTR
ncbi:hypothetical protein E2C01_088829 [Portunus trituberculatus]|uniref:Uncharacterized protein n=1 Tax=Portunus trituberculatus TaxID=210409 RepID=A0A5B7JAD9_PORTR|nr:hypothetical protein [Portunus trituberculatus]